VHWLVFVIHYSSMYNIKVTTTLKRNSNISRRRDNVRLKKIPMP